MSFFCKTVWPYCQEYVSVWIYESDTSHFNRQFVLYKLYLWCTERDRDLHHVILICCTGTHCFGNIHKQRLVRLQEDESVKDQVVNMASPLMQEQKKNLDTWFGLVSNLTSGLMPPNSRMAALLAGIWANSDRAPTTLTKTSSGWLVSRFTKISKALYSWNL